MTQSSFLAGPLPGTPSSLSDLISSLDKQTKGGGEQSVSPFTTVFSHFQLEILPPPPVLPGKAFSCLKGTLGSQFSLAVGTSYLQVVALDWLIDSLPFRASREIL